MVRFWWKALRLIRNSSHIAGGTPTGLPELICPLLAQPARWGYQICLRKEKIKLNLSPAAVHLIKGVQVNPMVLC